MSFAGQNVPVVDHGSKKKRTRLSVFQKLEICAELRKGTPPGYLMSTFGSGYRTIMRIKKEEPQLRASLANSGKSLKHKANRPYPQIDALVMKYIEIARAPSMPITQGAIQAHVFNVRDKLLATAKSIHRHEYLKKFTASKGWVNSFVQRHAIRSVSLHGEGSSVDTAAVADNIAKIREALRYYSNDQICNMDESGLFTAFLHAVLT